MKPRLRKCKVPGCERTGYRPECNFHISQRYKKSSAERLKSKPRKEPTGELELFKKIWSEREHVSFLTGRDLNRYESSIFFVNMFAHVLRKGYYKKQILNPENIILLTPEEHFLLDHGNSDQRAEYSKETGCDWDKIFEKRKLLLESLR